MVNRFHRHISSYIYVQLKYWHTQPTSFTLNMPPMHSLYHTVMRLTSTVSHQLCTLFYPSIPVCPFPYHYVSYHSMLNMYSCFHVLGKEWSLPHKFMLFTMVNKPVDVGKLHSFSHNYPLPPPICFSPSLCSFYHIHLRHSNYVHN